MLGAEEEELTGTKNIFQGDGPGHINPILGEPRWSHGIPVEESARARYRHAMVHVIDKGSNSRQG